MSTVFDIGSLKPFSTTGSQSVGTTTVVPSDQAWVGVAVQPGVNTVSVSGGVVVRMGNDPSGNFVWFFVAPAGSTITCTTTTTLTYARFDSVNPNTV